MKRAALAGIIASATLVVVMGMTEGARANFIVDGDFSTPNQAGGWSIYSPSTNSWMNTNGDGIEIGSSPIYGLPCISSGCQNLEVNANTFDTDAQSVGGLTIGQTYDLSWDYGGRTSGGPDELDVSFGGVLLVQDSGSVGSWTPNSFIVTATATIEDLVFASLGTDGLPSYGNEVTNVDLELTNGSLSAATPLPSAWTMMIAGFIGLGYFAFRGSKKSLHAVAAA